mmetsp:Transcript_109255/g.308202  ORF Transcript_109255/g.308202 Transcript_109255/m.308202 type:complete len:256 (-) Transcript_109255:1059-1826(-)
MTSAPSSSNPQRLLALHFGQPEMALCRTSSVETAALFPVTAASRCDLGAPSASRARPCSWTGREPGPRAPTSSRPRTQKHTRSSICSATYATPRPRCASTCTTRALRAPAELAARRRCRCRPRALQRRKSRWRNVPGVMASYLSVLTTQWKATTRRAQPSSSTACTLTPRGLCTSSPPRQWSSASEAPAPERYPTSWVATGASGRTAVLRCGPGARCVSQTRRSPCGAAKLWRWATCSAPAQAESRQRSSIQLVT